MARMRYPGIVPAALPADLNGNTRQRHILGNAPATRNIQPTATTNYYEATPNPAISHVPHDKPTQHPYRSGRRTARHRRGRDHPVSRPRAFQPLLERPRPAPRRIRQLGTARSRYAGIPAFGQDVRHLRIAVRAELLHPERQPGTAGQRLFAALRMAHGAAVRHRAGQRGDLQRRRTDLLRPFRAADDSHRQAPQPMGVGHRGPAFHPAARTLAVFQRTYALDPRHRRHGDPLSHPRHGHLRRERPREPALRPAQFVRLGTGTRTRHADAADVRWPAATGSSTTKGSTDASGAGCWPWASRARGSYRSRRCAT